MEFPLQIIFLLFAVAVLAGWVDAVAGGGGLITVPALLLAGVPPAAAIATNKLQGTIGTFTAAVYFFKKQVISIKGNELGLFAVCIGSIIGGFVLTRIDTRYLNFIVPILLLLTALYYIVYAKNLDKDRKPKLSSAMYNCGVAPTLGFYDGFFGPGTGSFMMTSFVTLRGFSIRKATGNAKLFNFASNLVALVYFVFFGQIVWVLGFTMMGGQVLGAYLGAKVAFDAGARVIRPITVFVCIAMSLSALWNLFFG